MAQSPDRLIGVEHGIAHPSGFELALEPALQQSVERKLIRRRSLLSSISMA